MKLKLDKKIRPEQDSNPWLLRQRCSAPLTSLSSQWELVTLWVHNVPVGVEEYKWIHERSYIWPAQVVCITAMINHVFISLSTGQIIVHFMVKYKIFHVCTNTILKTHSHEHGQWVTFWNDLIREAFPFISQLLS